MTGPRGRPSRASLCVCCGLRTDDRMPFPRSRPDILGRLPAFDVPICCQCRRLVGSRRFLSIASMRHFVQWHLAQSFGPLNLPAPEAIARLSAGERRAFARLSRTFAAINARCERRLRYDPNRRNASGLRQTVRQNAGAPRQDRS